MMQLTEELTSTENKISFARQAYNTIASSTRPCGRRAPRPRRRERPTLRDAARSAPGGAQARPRDKVVGPSQRRRPGSRPALRCRAALPRRPEPRRTKRRTGPVEGEGRAPRVTFPAERPIRGRAREARTRRAALSESRRRCSSHPRGGAPRGALIDRHVDDEPRPLRGPKRIVAVVAALDVDGQGMMAGSCGMLVDGRRIGGAKRWRRRPHDAVVERNREGSDATVVAARLEVNLDA